MKDDIGRILGDCDYDADTEVHLDSLSITELIFIIEDETGELLTFGDVKACKTWGEVERLFRKS